MLSEPNDSGLGHEAVKMNMCLERRLYDGPIKDATLNPKTEYLQQHLFSNRRMSPKRPMAQSGSEVGASRILRLKPYANYDSGADYPGPKKVNLFNYGRII